MNGDAEDQAAQQYTILMPGMRDIFAKPVITKAYQDRLRREGVPESDIPALSSEMERKWIQERVIRMKNAYSPVPEKLRWIPTVINYIDDAQDIFITALTLGKILAPRLMARFIPYVGWALLISDIMNIGTAVLSIPLTGPSGKKLGRAVIRGMLGNRAKRISRAAEWMTRTRWFPFLLQAGQASETLTGYGLRLGPIMGTASDSIWGAIRYAEGKQVRIVGPPPSDPISKAARFLSQGFLKTQLSQEISQDDKEYLNLAEALAARMIMDETISTPIDDRADDLGTTECAIYEPWHPVSREVLAAEEIDPSGDLRIFNKDGILKPTYQESVYTASRWHRFWEAEQAVYHQFNDAGSIHQMVQDQAGSDAWDWMLREPGTVSDAWDPINLVITTAIELSVYPPPGVVPGRVLWWIREVESEVDWFAGGRPTWEMLTRNALKTMGGWVDFPPVEGYAQFRTTPKGLAEYRSWYLQ